MIVVMIKLGNIFLVNASYYNPDW